MFHIGQKVVCVFWDNRPADAVARGVRFPEPGETYTIREISFSASHRSGTLRFHELRNPPIAGGVEPEFVTCSCDGRLAFRPVINRSTETGMSILRKLLDGAPVREDA